MQLSIVQTILGEQVTATNEKSQLDYPIQTMCVDLINAARELSVAYRFGSDYRYSNITNSTLGPNSYPYLVALGNDYTFGSHWSWG